MATTILITGGTGLIGRSLTQALLNKGYKVNWLSRRTIEDAPAGVNIFYWDVYQGKIEENAIEDVEAVVHLAGENIGAKPWTNKRKKEIIESRTKSIQLIYDLIRRRNHQVRTVISSSAVGFYGDRDNEILQESSSPGTGFLAETCIRWEAAVDQAPRDVRVVKLRTGIVLDRKEGALPQLETPIKRRFGAALGNGKQWIPWIHLHDIVNMYVFALENRSLTGPYNAAAPNPITNRELTLAIAEKVRRKVWLPNVPAFALRIILGQMCEMVLMSNRTSSDKILTSGFTFAYPTIKEALASLYA